MYIIIFWLVKKLHDVKGKQFVTAFTKSFPQFYSVCKITSKYTSVIALYLIHKVEMIFCSFLFVCLFVPYTNPHFWTSLNQTLHTSPPSSGRDRRVCMVRKCLTLFYLFDLFAGNECRILGTTWLLAQDTSATALYLWFFRLLVWRHIVADDTCSESSATALYPWFLQVLVWRHEMTL